MLTLLLQLKIFEFELVINQELKFMNSKNIDALAI